MFEGLRGTIQLDTQADDAAIPDAITDASPAASLLSAQVQETPEVPDSLWDRAYDSLIQDGAELVGKYEALLDRVLNSEDDGDP